MSQITGFTDTPIDKSSDDTLEIKHYLESLGSFILKCETPLTISIQGEWGTGKTSAMNIVREVLEAEKVPTVWFNTWQFSQFTMQDYLPVSMLNSLMEAIGNPGEVRSTLDKVWSLCANATKTVGKGAAMFAMEKAVGGTVTGMVLGSENPKEASLQSPLQLADDIRRLKGCLAKGVKDRIEKEQSGRMVVFIDDLDRIEPRKAVELLEVMKNFLDVPGCVFVIAVDHSVVEQGIKSKFGLEKIDRKGRSFFDKIIQLSFNLPVAQYNTHSYIRRIIQQMGVSVDNADSDVRRYVSLISSSVGFNPRGIKRIFNLFQLLCTVAEKTSVLDPSVGISESRIRQILFGLLCLQTGFPELYAHLMKAQDSLDPQYLSILAGQTSEDTYPVDPLYDQEISGDERIEEMRSFMAVFVSVLDHDDNGEISALELKCLKGLLAFSAITSNEDSDRPRNTRQREKLESFHELQDHFEEGGVDRSLSLSLYEVLDKKIVEYCSQYGKPYFRNITSKGVVTYNVDRSDIPRSKGNKSVVFVFSYAQAGGVALHIGLHRQTLRSSGEIDEELINRIFVQYDYIFNGRRLENNP